MKKINSKGFTLIELLAIVVILAVIIALAAPSMTREIKRSEEEIQTFARYTRIFASTITKSRRNRITY